MQCFVASLAIGGLLAFLKILIGSIIIMNFSGKRAPARCMRCFFVDMMTRRIYIDLCRDSDERNKTRFTIERK